MIARTLKAALFASTIFLAGVSASAQQKNAATSEKFDLQFFGDTYIPVRVLSQTGSDRETSVFRDLQPMLESSHTNIVNLEGSATTASIPMTEKRFVLQMPESIAELLSSNNIHVASLANNHAMDLGWQGLFDTITAMHAAGVRTVGGGWRIAEAMAPVILPVNEALVCINAVSRTFPELFWATEERPGTANPALAVLLANIRAQRESSCLPIVVIHWGRENERKAQPYQRRLARQFAAAGAIAVIGHHPHVLQEIETIDGMPVFYSLGNFVFGTRPVGTTQEGMSVRMRLRGNGPSGSTTVELVATPLQVDNSMVDFRPRPFAEDERHPLSKIQSKENRCAGFPEHRSSVCLKTEIGYRGN